MDILKTFRTVSSTQNENYHTLFKWTVLQHQLPAHSSPVPSAQDWCYYEQILNAHMNLDFLQHPGFLIWNPGPVNGFRLIASRHFLFWEVSGSDSSKLQESFLEALHYKTSASVNLVVRYIFKHSETKRRKAFMWNLKSSGYHSKNVYALAFPGKNADPLIRAHVIFYFLSVIFWNMSSFQQNRLHS